MGLDMYLEIETYILDSQKDDMKIIGVPGVAEDANVKQIIERVGYWRKENHIHKWFVDNVQEGRDECERSYVSKDKLKDLKRLCERVLDDPSLADGLLPTQEGFFFGSTEYDEYYFQGLKDTIEICDSVLDRELVPFQTIYYESSW